MQRWAAGATPRCVARAAARCTSGRDAAEGARWSAAGSSSSPGRLRWHAVVAGGIPPWLPESSEQNHVVTRAIVAAAREYAAGGFTVVIDGVDGPWLLDAYRPLEHQYVVLRPARETTLGRACGRSDPRDLVDAAPVLALWDQFADLGPLERHVVDSTDSTAEETVRTVLDGLRDGRWSLRG